MTDNLTLSGGYGYVKTEINDDTLAVAPCGSGICTILDPMNANGLALVDGNPFQHAPEWTGNFEIDYSYPLPDAGAEVYLFSDWKFRGETNDFLYESLENVIGGIDFANLLAYTNEPRTWGVNFSWRF